MGGAIELTRHACISIVYARVYLGTARARDLQHDRGVESQWRLDFKKSSVAFVATTFT